jgi:gamma-glutamylcyclotransferase (GGCT)/AIG2-like uncharacterized protein YtfP
MNPAIMRRKKLKYTSRQRATLPGFGLRFNKKSQREKLPVSIGFANVVESPGEAVEGVLYELPEQLRHRLDEVENSPEHYARIEVTVESASGPCTCSTYTALPSQVADDLIPSRNYINHILAAREFLSREYCERLDGLETYSGECACCHKVREMIFLREGENLFVVCAPCREAKQIWSDTRGVKLSVLETEAIMQHILSTGTGYASIQALVKDAIRLGLIESAGAGQ